jgi:sulfur-oxidizing protein SoxX
MNIASSVFRLLLFACCLPASAADIRTLPVDYCHWTPVQFEIREPLCGLQGDTQRGREIAADAHLGNCLACHQLPIPEKDFHGTLGPPLHNVAARYTEAQLRMRIVDEQQINPATIMPGFYADPRRANRVTDEYWGKTFLTAQQVEDVIAYLKTLK